MTAKKEDNPVVKVNRICHLIKDLSNDDIECVRDFAERQACAIYPLKSGTQARVNKMGKYNLRVIREIKKLREIILSYE